MNADEYLEKLQEDEFRKLNERSYAQLRFKPDEPGYGPEECECGEPMPLARREYGFKQCVPCKELTERR